MRLQRCLSWSAASQLLPVLAQATAPAEPGVGNYPVNAGDVLEVLVWKEENLQKQVVVRPDGYFSFPLTGDVRAEGRTITAISEDIIGTDRPVHP